MATPTSVELVISGIINGQLIQGAGTLEVDASTGTKSGTVVYSKPPPPGTPAGDSAPAGTTRCFIGAKPAGRNRFVGPLELLGREFVSLRVTTLGRAGYVSLSEKATFVKGVLRSELTVVGELRAPAGRGIGPIREVITVHGDGSLISEGRYTLLTGRGRPVPARYTHFYRPLRPNRRLFRRLKGSVFLLRAWVESWPRGRRAVRFRTTSTVSLLRDR